MALGTLNDRTAIETLKSELDDPNASVRCTACVAMAMIGDETCCAIVIAYPD